MGDSGKILPLTLFTARGTFFNRGRESGSAPVERGMVGEPEILYDYEKIVLMPGKRGVNYRLGYAQGYEKSGK
jgi:hypothetical protein